MSSLVDVVNDALASIGESPIAGLDDPTTKAQICATHVPIVLRAMLFDHRWNFNYTRVALAPDATPPVSGFQYQYTLPPDYARVWGVGDDERRNGAPNGDIDWKVEKGKVLTDIGTSLVIHYGTYEDDPNKWSGGFTLAFSPLLASRLAGSIANRADMAQQFLKDYVSVLLPNAMAGDSQESSVDTFDSPDLLIVRNA